MSELAIIESQPMLVRPIAKPAEIVARHKEMVVFVNETLEDGKDFGVIPGTTKQGEAPKKVLLKPGAERLAIGCGLIPNYEFEEKEIDHARVIQTVITKWNSAKGLSRHEQDELIAEGKGRRRNSREGGQYFQIREDEIVESRGLYRYVIRCRVLTQDGREVGQGVGSCSSLESKYVRAPWDAENTVLKMAKKRAFVDAMLTTLGLSDRFTQDVEDIQENTQARNQAAPADYVIDAEIVEDPSEVTPDNWLTYLRPLTQQQSTDAVRWMKEDCAMTKEQFEELKSACQDVVPRNDWRLVLLQARSASPLPVTDYTVMLSWLAPKVEEDPYAGESTDPKAETLDPRPERSPETRTSGSPAEDAGRLAAPTVGENSPETTSKPILRKGKDVVIPARSEDGVPDVSAFGWKPTSWPSAATNLMPGNASHRRNIEAAAKAAGFDGDLDGARRLLWIKLGYSLDQASSAKAHLVFQQFLEAEGDHAGSLAEELAALAELAEYSRGEAVPA